MQALQQQHTISRWRQQLQRHTSEQCRLAVHEDGIRNIKLTIERSTFTVWRGLTTLVFPSDAWLCARASVE